MLSDNIEVKKCVGEIIDTLCDRVGDDDTENDFQPWKSPNWNEDLWESCDRVGIPKERVKFTSFKDKIEFLEGKDFLFHLDDDLYELTAIMESGDPCKPVNVNHFEWRETCEDILKIKK